MCSRRVGGRQQAILLYFYPFCLACLSTGFIAMLGSLGNWLGIRVHITATEEHKNFLARGAKNIGLKSRNKSLLTALIEEMAKLRVAQCVH